MSKCGKLLEAARNNPAGLRFMELCALAECHGWEFRRQRGSHLIYARPGHRQRLTLTAGGNASANRYQVEQLLAALGPLADVEET